MGLFETKNKLSEVCDQVARTSEPVVVTRHGEPLVKIVPCEPQTSKQSVWSRVQESRRKYGPIEEEFELPERSIQSRPDPLG